MLITLSVEEKLYRTAKENQIEQGKVIKKTQAYLTKENNFHIPDLVPVFSFVENYEFNVKRHLFICYLVAAGFFWY